MPTTDTNLSKRHNSEAVLLQCNEPLLFGVLGQGSNFIQYKRTRTQLLISQR